MANEINVCTVQELISNGVLEKPLDGNHGGIHPKGSDFIDSGIPFIMASDLINGEVDTKGCKFISFEQASTLRKGFAKAGDVLLSHKATIGANRTCRRYRHRLHHVDSSGYVLQSKRLLEAE